ncbi:MAG: PadR family transcriptional regulator [Candidatus Bathyarchaeia archaeon]
MSWCSPSFRPKEGLSPIQMLLLMLLNKRPMHGYELANELKERFENHWKPNLGTIYHALSRLSEKGLVSAKVEPSKAGPERKTYVINENGKQMLKDASHFFSSFMECWEECCA